MTKSAIGKAVPRAIAIRTLIVTSCTGEKRFKPDNQLTLEDFKDVALLAKREAELAEFAYPAGEMYTGAQHLRLMEGVKLLRQKLGRDVIDVAIASAGYGLIAEDRVIAPYEVTFNTMKVAEVDAWAEHLGMHAALEKIVRDYDLVFLLLGENYLRSLALPISTRSDQTFIFLASPSSMRWIGDLDAKTFILPLSNSDAKQYRYGLVGLKGFLFKMFAEVAAKDANWFAKVYDTPEYFEEAIAYVTGTVASSKQLELSLGIASVSKLSKQSKPKLDSNYLLIPENLPSDPNFPKIYFPKSFVC